MLCPSLGTHRHGNDTNIATVWLVLTFFQQGGTMKLQVRRSPIAAFVISFVFVVAFLGCSSIQLIAPFDQKIDDGITNLQKSTAEFLTSIERQGGSTPADYQKHAKFYDDTKVTLSGLIVRAKAISQNGLTAQELDNLSKQYQELEIQDQKYGVKSAEIPQLESAFNRTFTALLTLETAKKPPSSQGATK